MKAWLVAARPPTLLASIAPVLVGAGAAAGDDAFRWDVGLVALGCAVLLNVAVNFANDASDAGRGVDGPERIGPPRAVSGGLLTARQVWLGTAVAMALAAVGGIYLAFVGGWVILALGAAAILAALGYSGGPWPYGSHGLGELAVFVFFGPVAVVGTRYAFDGHAPTLAWTAAVPVGLTAAAILVVNNIRDLETDGRSSKRTLAVMLGRSRTRVLFTALLAAAFAWVATAAAIDRMPQWSLLAMVAVPLALPPARLVWTSVEGRPLIRALKQTARMHAVFGVLLAIGLAIAT